MQWDKYRTCGYTGYHEAGIVLNAVSFIMVHNHLLGARKPSDADDRLTEAVKKAAGTLDIRLLDHVIVAGNNYYSYADEGKL